MHFTASQFRVLAEAGLSPQGLFEGLAPIPTSRGFEVMDAENRQVYLDVDFNKGRNTFSTIMVNSDFGDLDFNEQVFALGITVDRLAVASNGLFKIVGSVDFGRALDALRGLERVAVVDEARDLYRAFLKGELKDLSYQELGGTSLSEIALKWREAGSPKFPVLKELLDEFLLTPYQTWSGKPPRYGGQHRRDTHTGALNLAINYHERVMNGERWPELERAFLYRKNTFKGLRGQHVRPRAGTLLRYLHNIDYRWPEGMKLAKTFLSTPKDNYDDETFQRFSFGVKAIHRWNPNVIRFIAESGFYQPWFYMAFGSMLYNSYFSIANKWMDDEEGYYRKREEKERQQRLHVEKYIVDYLIEFLDDFSKDSRISVKSREDLTRNVLRIPSVQRQLSGPFESRLRDRLVKING